MRRVRLLAIGVAGALAAACGSGSPSAPPPLAGPAPLATPTPPPTPVPAANEAPVLDVRFSPRPITGASPLTIAVDMCRTSDPEGDPLRFAFEFEGEGKVLVPDCRATHTYGRPWTGQAYFCATDGDPEHLICRIVPVSVS